MSLPESAEFSTPPPSILRLCSQFGGEEGKRRNAFYFEFRRLFSAASVRTETMTTPSGKIIPPRQRKIALLGSRSVGKESLSVSPSRPLASATCRESGGVRWGVLQRRRRAGRQAGRGERRGVSIWGKRRLDEVGELVA